ncbi:PAS domain S-box protein [Chlorobaculum sp. 24CR]|uniref:PAS domain-containing hybrid sensor histidine kinase/response regulator n=1 Tax=Chlorobaculum sp. 24CR TaxID=2508878 RepID=UPI00100B601F|nr:PAS domain S-box protein [Chlorobaculum sp. 24CR]RXK81636.1 PAS domain S-box protein [Chlorobaculum sp. 24CR]
MSEKPLAEHRDDEIRRLRQELEEAHRSIDGLQTELAGQQRFTGALLEATPDFFALKDRDFVYRRVNPALCRFLGKSAGEIVGKRDAELFSPEVAALYVSRDAEVLKTRQPLEGDWSIGGLSGKSWFRVKKTPVFDASGEVSGILCMARDVSQHKRAEIEFERLFNLMPDMVCIASASSGCFTRVNQAWQQTLGYAAQELLSIPFLELIHPDDLESTGEEIQRLVAGAGSRNFVNRYRAKDGSYHWFEWNSTSLEEGMLYAVARDITERIEQEMQTRRWADAFRLCAHGIAIGVPGKNVVLTCNESFARMRGQSVEEVEGASIVSLYVPEDQETVRNNLKVTDITGFCSYHARMMRKDGAAFPVQMDVVGVKDTDGQLIYRVATVQDITERLESQRALRESEERFRSVVESAPDAIFIQTGGCFAYLNRSAVSLFGASKAEEILGRRVVDLIHPDYRDLVAERIRQLNKSQQAAPILEERILRLDGAEASVEVSAVPFTFAGQQGALVFLRDIDRRKKAEEERAGLEHQLFQSQKIESIGRLAGGIAHDLNNLLTPVLGYSEMLSHAFPETDKRLKRIEVIHHAALRARDLVRHLLAFSSRQALEFRMIDLNSVIGDFGQLLRRTIRADIDIRYRLHEGALVMQGDASQLEQIIMNLAVNAEDAMPSGGELKMETSTLVIESGCEKYFEGLPAGNYAVLTVTDTGVGMERETLAHIFEPFFTTKPKGQGTGLGLATVYGIVRQHGGIIQASSIPGAGASFRICFPLQASEPEPAQPDEPKSQQKSNGAKVLVVEDDEMVRKFVVQALDEEEFDIRAAESGEAALALIESGAFTPELLLTDLVMRGMNGRVLYEKVSGLMPGIKVIYMSGYTKDIISRHGVLDEGLTFLQKPFAVPVLLDKVRQVLQNGG